MNDLDTSGRPSTSLVKAARALDWPWLHERLLHPASSRAWFDLAQGLLDAGRDAEALRAFERAYALDRQATPAE